MPTFRHRTLDLRPPSDNEHVEKYPASGLMMMRATVAHVEKQLTLPKRYHGFYDQGEEGACVGFGGSIMMSIYNRKLYDPVWLYREAQLVDEFEDTPPQEGTSLRAGFDILRDVGHRQIWAGNSRLPSIQHGIVKVNRWLQTVDEGRTALSKGHPLLDGVPWFFGFYKPVEKRVKVRGRERVEYWIPEPSQWGRMVGYHAITRTGASDERQAFAWFNSWGAEYPWPVYISYEAHERLMRVGESAMVTSR